MINLLYLHGLLGKPVADKMEVLARKATHVFAPQLDYFEHPDLFGWLLEQIAEHQINYLAGSSAGGLMAYWLARHTGCKALLFNPAAAKFSLRADIVKHMTNHVPTKPYFYDIVIGEKDDTILPQTTLDFLAKNEDKKNYALHFFPELGHRIDLETFKWGAEKIIL